uniref:Uncharacterized protein n=1 Tax=Ixodes ricinus TaxID=34613 RepID=A0A6B0UC91_IXORI
MICCELWWYSAESCPVLLNRIIFLIIFIIFIPNHMTSASDVVGCILVLQHLVFGRKENRVFLSTGINYALRNAQSLSKCNASSWEHIPNF